MRDKTFEEFFVQGRTIEEKLTNLDITNQYHILWIYKNVVLIYHHSKEKFNKILLDLSVTKLTDFTVASSVMEEIASLLHKCYQIKIIDEEIEYVVKKATIEGKDDRSKDETTESINYSFLKEYFFKMLLPLTMSCTKEVVDVMRFLYDKKERKDFDELFSIYNERQDVIVELYLLKARLIQEEEDASRGRQMEENKEEETNQTEEETNQTEEGTNQIEEETNQIEEGTNQTEEFVTNKINSLKIECSLSNEDDQVTFKVQPCQSSSTGQSSNTLNPTHLPILPSILLDKPFSKVDYYLKKAKESILKFENISLRFFLDNISTYLGVSYDEELFSLFCKYTSGGYRHHCAKVAYRMKKVPRKMIEEMVEGMVGLEREILKGDGMVVDEYTLGLYVKWCKQPFTLSTVTDFIDQSRLFLRFLREAVRSCQTEDGTGEKNKNEDGTGEKNKNEDGTGEKNKNEDGNDPASLRTSPAALRTSPASLHTLPNMIKVMLDILKTLLACKIEKVEENVKKNIIRDISSIVKIFYQYNTTSRDLVTNNLVTYFEDVIRDFSSKKYRRDLVSHLDVLEYFNLEYRKGILKILFSDFDTDWRYRRDLLVYCKKNMESVGFKGTRWIEGFLKDKAFIVRETARDIMKESYP